MWVLSIGREAAGAQSSSDAFSRAVALEARGNHAAALALLWTAAGDRPRDPDVQNRLGEALARIGALDAAIDSFRVAVAERPDFRKASNNLILTLVQAGRGPEAVARARALADAAPDDADRQFTLGLALSEQDAEASMAAFREVLRIQPRHALAEFNLALVLKRTDRMAEAIDRFERALAIEDRAETYYQLGVLHWQQGDSRRAAAALRAAIARDPRAADAYYTLGAVLAGRGEPEEAARALRQSIAIRPDVPGAHYTLARVLGRTGDPEASRALAEAERLARRRRLEQEAVVRTAVGSRRLASGDLAGALEELRRAIAACEDYAPAHYQLGLVLQRLDQPDAARAAWARAAQLNPALAPPSPAR